MKRSLIRLIALFLVVALSSGLLPTLALAGDGPEKIWDVEVYVSYPIAGRHPVLSGLTEYDESPYTVDEVHFFELDSEGMPMGKFLDESYSFVAGQDYFCQVFVIPDEDYVFADDPWASINSHRCDVEVFIDGRAILSYTFTCASGTATITWDVNGGTAPAPAPLEVPIGGTVWDVLRNFELVELPDMPHAKFLDWSLSNFGTEYEDYYSFADPVYEPLTLYAIWQPCPQSVELFVELPEDCMIDTQYGPNVLVPDYANYSVDSDNFYVGLVDGYPHDDLVYCDPLQKGMTYYSRATVYMNVGAEPPELILHGADVVSLERDYWGEVLYVTFSVTIPAEDELSQASVYVKTPYAGWSADHPEIFCLTPGVQMGVQGWYTNADLSGEPYEGELMEGKTYYALISIGDATETYRISWDKLKLEVQGVNAKLVRMVNLASEWQLPNYAGAVVAVTIPEFHEFAICTSPSGSSPLEGGRFTSDRYATLGWVECYDFGEWDHSPVTVTAKAAPGWEFLMWFDNHQQKTLSKEQTITLTLDRDINLTAYFVEGTPFVDVSAQDYFFWPVKWATEREPRITKGTDETHFSPYLSCTREQVMTFLWAANNKPEPTGSGKTFSDVPKDAYYYKAVQWAVENKITSGMGDGSFGVGQTCTRAQVMTFLWAANGKPAPQSANNPFQDVSSSDYFYKSVLWAVEQGVTKGTSATTFGPNDPCTRAQVITFLYKLYGPVG